MDRQKRTWAEIDLDNIRYNYRSMRKALKPEQKFLGVVKANAYGHGAVQVARVLEKEGADYLAVACIDEAVELRDSGIKLPVLILGITDPKYTDVLIEKNITQAVGSLENAKKMSETAVNMGKTVKIHLKADSGMGRVGFVCYGDRDPAFEMAEVIKLPGLEVEGIFTHFAVSDELGDEFTNMQFDAFCAVCHKTEELSGKKFKIRHCTNSGAMINYEWTYMDMVRPGIALYGCYPAAEKGQIDLKPVMQVKTRIAQIKDFEAGDTVSYGRTCAVAEKRRIAIVPIGYADGLHRVLSGKIDMLLSGKRVKQIGRICMDMCMIDVTDVPDAKVGDVVTVFGCDGEAVLPVEEQAEKAGTISYELLCAVSPRIPRIYSAQSAE